MRLIFFFQNTLNLTEISERQKKIENKFSIEEMSALELIAINSTDSNENTCNRQSMC